MKILVLGSSGVIGTSLCLELISLGHEVIGVDNRKNIWTKRIPTIIQDLRIDTEGIPKESYDVAVCLAANAMVHELVMKPKMAIDNTKITFSCLEFCREREIPIIFSSSREVYGNIMLDLTSEKHCDHHNAASPYSASKMSGEAFIYSYSRCYDLPHIVFRFSNVYGRFDTDLDRGARVIPLFINNIRKNKPITVFGSDKTLDFTYIDDCLSGIIAGIENLHRRKVVNETINLGFGEGRKLVDLVDIIERELAISPNCAIKESRKGEVTHYVADISKAKNLLGFNPITSLDIGISKTIKWQRNFYNW